MRRGHYKRRLKKKAMKINFRKCLDMFDSRGRIWNPQSNVTREATVAGSSGPIVVTARTLKLCRKDSEAGKQLTDGEVNKTINQKINSNGKEVIG